MAPVVEGGAGMAGPVTRPKDQRMEGPMARGGVPALHHSGAARPRCSNAVTSSRPASGSPTPCITLQGLWERHEERAGE